MAEYTIRKTGGRNHVVVDLHTGKTAKVVATRREAERWIASKADMEAEEAQIREADRATWYGSDN